MNRKCPKCPRCHIKTKLSVGDDRYIPIHYYCSKCSWSSSDPKSKICPSCSEYTLPPIFGDKCYCVKCKLTI